MKNYIISLKIIVALLFVIFSFVNCNEDVSAYLAGGDIEITETLPEGGTYGVNVTGLQASSRERQIVVSWNLPADRSDLAYFLIVWEGQGTADATVYTQSVEKSQTSFTLNNLFNEAYEITVKCVSSSFVASEGVSVTEEPVHDTEAPDAVQNLVAQPLAVAAALTWDNPTDEDFYKIAITVINLADQSERSIELPSYATSYQVVNLEEMSEYEVIIDTYDYIGNKSTTSVQFKTLAEVLLSNSLWEIAGFSAEETSGEGSTGRAKDVFDNNDATFWHSPWTGGGSTLPQWIVIDLNQEVIPTTLISYKRNNNNNGPTSVKIEGSLDNDEWFDFGTFNLARDNNDGQPCNLRNTTRVRYIKYTVLTSPNGYAMVREIKLRALVGD